MGHTLLVKVTKYYGNVTIYPDCELSRTFAQLLGQKTLTQENVKYIKALGYEVRTKGEIL